MELHKLSQRPEFSEEQLRFFIEHCFYFGYFYLDRAVLANDTLSIGRYLECCKNLKYLVGALVFAVVDAKGHIVKFLLECERAKEIIRADILTPCKATGEPRNSLEAALLYKRGAFERFIRQKYAEVLDCR